MDAWLRHLAWLCLAIALGLALAALQFSLGIPEWVMQSALIVFLGLGLFAAAVVAWQYYRAIAKDDDY
jgi:hypothetical protein